MSLTVYKYQFAINDYFTIYMPEGAQILKVDAINEMPCIWALVDKEKAKAGAPLMPRTFRLSGTGHEITEPAEHIQHVSTFFMNRGLLVWHVFEVPPDWRPVTGGA